MPGRLGSMSISIKLISIMYQRTSFEAHGLGSFLSHYYNVANSNSQILLSYSAQSILEWSYATEGCLHHYIKVEYTFFLAAKCGIVSDTVWNLLCTSCLLNCIH